MKSLLKKKTLTNIATLKQTVYSPILDEWEDTVENGTKEQIQHIYNETIKLL